MSQPIRWTSHDSATETGPGEAQKSRVHPVQGLWVKVENFDPGVDSVEVRIEGSADGDHYAPMHSGAPEIEDVLSITGNSLTQSDINPDVYVGYVSQHNQIIEWLRANVVEHSGGFNVTTEVFVSGWTARGVSFKSRDFEVNPEDGT